MLKSKNFNKPENLFLCECVTQMYETQFSHRATHATPTLE